jgi:type 1 glutamine amidotransferase
MGWLLSMVLLVVFAGATFAGEAGAKKKILFMHGKASHGFGGHAYAPAFKMLARMLNKNVPEVEAIVVGQDWPSDEQLKGATAIMLGSDAGMLVKKYAKQLEPLMEKGIGLGCIHYTVDPAAPEAVQNLIKWIGGSYERNWSVNPHWLADFKSFPDHPAARGLKPFKCQDEWYYHMRFAKDMKGVTPILQAIPPESTRNKKFGPHSGNPTVKARKGMNEVVCWVYERPGGGRGFGFTGMHTHWTWGQDSFRKCVLNCLVWIAGAEVPKDGVPSKRPTVEEMVADLGQKPPKNWNAEAMQKKIEEMNK